MLHLEEIKNYLENANCKWCEQESMTPHTTFRIGGPAALFVEVTSVEQLSGLLTKLFRKGGGGHG